MLNWTLVHSGLTNDESDSVGDAAEIAVTGWLYFVAQIPEGQPALAPGQSSTGASYWVRTFKGYLDTDGVLKNAPGGTPGIRLWANDPAKLNLEDPGLPYLVFAPDDLRANGKIIKFDPFVFYAPNADITKKFSELQPVPSATAQGIARGFRGFRSELVKVSAAGVTPPLYQWRDETGELWGAPQTYADIFSDSAALAATAAAPGAIAANLAARNIAVTDVGGGQAQLTIGGVPVGSPFTPTAPVWSGISGKPAVLAAGVDGLAARKAVDAALDYPVDVPIVISTNAETNATNDKTLVGTSRAPYLVQVDATNIKLVYTNFTYASGTQEDLTPSTDMVIGGAALEYAGVITRVTFAGQYAVTIKPGGQVTSDPISIDVVAGSYLNVRTYTPSGTWHSIRYVINVAAAIGGFTATTDLTAPGSAAIADGANVHLAGPVAILGTPIARANFSGVIRRPRVAVIGDSIVNGHNDGIYNAGFTGWIGLFSGLGRGGWVDRAAQAYGFLVLKLGMPGYTAQKALNTPASRRFSYAQINKASNLIWSLGVNDINAGRTLAQLQADLIALWTIQASQGKRCFALTLTPIANSTDIFQTLANQSVLSGEAVRVAYNTWLRDGAPMVNGVAVATGTTGATVSRANYLTGNTVTSAASGPLHPLYGTVEFANTVESAQNSGKWKVPYSTRQVNDIVATAGNYYFISNTAALASPADVGKKVYISGAGASGAGLLTSIVSISGPTQPLIADPIVTAVNPQVGIIYDPLTTDGIHPGPSAHEALKTAVPYSHFL
jgi:hypothetical protein